MEYGYGYGCGSEEYGSEMLCMYCFITTVSSTLCGRKSTSVPEKGN